MESKVFFSVFSYASHNKYIWLPQWMHVQNLLDVLVLQSSKVMDANTFFVLY